MVNEYWFIHAGNNRTYSSGWQNNWKEIKKWKFSMIICSLSNNPSKYVAINYLTNDMDSLLFLTKRLDKTFEESLT